jgi:diaminopimelate epimerase
MTAATPTAFLRVSGGGNDFLALVEPATPPTSDAIAAWCRRGVSLGADGVFTIRRDNGVVRIDYWNADGQPAALCLNATRCAARLAFDRGWAAQVARVATGAGEFSARRRGTSDIAVELPPPAAPRQMRVEVAGRSYDGVFVAVGVPHFVLFWPASLAAAPIAELGAALRHHPAFAPAGTNVNFVRLPRPDFMEIRSFERGVEAETLACGTGILAAAAAAVAEGRAGLPLQVQTAGGFVLGVEGEVRDGGIARWALVGDARVLAREEVLPEAALVPPLPVWS